MIQIKIYDTDTFDTIRVIDVADEAEALSAGTRWIAWYAEQGITNVAWDYLRPASGTSKCNRCGGKVISEHEPEHAYGGNYWIAACENDCSGEEAWIYGATESEALSLFAIKNAASQLDGKLGAWVEREARRKEGMKALSGMLEQ